MSRPQQIEGCGTAHAPPPHPPRSKDENGEELPMNRLFDPTMYPKSFKPSEMTVSWDQWTLLACQDSQVQCASCKNRPFHCGCIVISVGAKCLNSSEPPRCAIGVYYGINNPLNVASEIKEAPFTEQVAILRACIIALTHVISNCQVTKPKRRNEMAFPLHTVVIRTDSPYLVQGVTEWMTKWKLNGWKTAKGQPVANESMWRLIDVWIRQLEPEVMVKFWLVSKAMNMTAGCLTLYGMHGPKELDGSSPGFMKLADSNENKKKSPG
ncbi:hypothetical protein N7478_002482 [Penicillium angulare]|uniref:uncharacterized protein n=1 Tax=Penicillium angulare TaxID=116970 RepID=UPI0025417FDE|nr:uncharacterized protein N7478_002482 [Penicillium angulare]KAJ5286796.1 hypothetical protein N7478_002482 [Penicillium angulare]